MPLLQLLLTLCGVVAIHSFLHPPPPNIAFSLHTRTIRMALKDHQTQREQSTWKILSNGTSVDNLESSTEEMGAFDTLSPTMMELQSASVPTAEAESWLHAVSLISGTTIGAGILALPAVTVSSGFLASTVSMTIGYGIMTLSGLYIAELSLGQRSPGDAWNRGGVLDLYAPAEQSNRVLRQFLSVGAYFFLHYAMMVAYIAQGGSNPIFTLPDILSSLLSSTIGPMLFTAIMASSLYALPKRILSWINNLMVFGVFGSMAIVLVVGASTLHIDTLLLPPDWQHPEYILQSFPIILLAFVYHNIIPTVVKDCQYDVPRIQSAIVGGTTLPFLLFVAWNAVILGNIDSAIMAANAAGGGGDVTIDPVAILIANEQDSASFLRPMISTFSTLAVMTSLIGFTYGLQEAWMDVLSKFQEGFQLKESATMREPTSTARLGIFALIFVPPLLMAIYNPDIFVPALDYGGAFGVTLLFVLLPSYGIWMQRYGNGDASSKDQTEELVPGGKGPILGLGAATGLLLVQQVVEKFGFLSQIVLG
jgi:tyrosine-specific transport protein